MSESESRNVGRDVVGIALFGLAVFAAISVVMSWLQPVDDPGGTTAAVGLLVGAIGTVPGLVLSAGLAWMGARLWLLGRNEGLLRDLVGLAGTTAGLTVLAGAVHPGAGGALGALTGGAVTGFLTAFVGVPFGLACLLIPIWFVWVRPREVISWNLGQDEGEPAAALTEVEGVSAAEAEALLPRIPPPDRAAPPPPSPYPPDVRLQGQVPEGTIPIAAPDEPRATSPARPAADEPVSLRADERTAEPASERAGEDLAEVVPPPRVLPAVEPPAVAPEARPLAEAQASAPAAEPIEQASLPKPSWEQSNLYEEPVDAYGTPLSVLETHRGEGAPGAVVDPPDRSAVAPAEDAEVSLAELAELTTADVADVEDEQEVLAEEVEEEPEEEPVEHAEVEVEDEEEEEEEEYEYEEDEEEPEEGEYAEDEEEEEEYEEDEEEEVYAEADDEPEEGEYAEEAEPEEEDEEEVEVAEDDEEEVRAEDGDSEGVESEPQVELRPAAPPRPAAELAAEAAARPDDFPTSELVQAAGNLFLERGRVAVSLLQREYELDFQQATAVLDQLQDQGLIGPYLGGHKRDILLTAEEWRAKAAAM